MNQTLITQGIPVDELLESFRSIVRSEIQAIPKPEKESFYMDIDECSLFTKRSKGLLYQDTFLKRIPHLKKGGKLLFNRAEIIKWLEESAQPVEMSVDK